MYDDEEPEDYTSIIETIPYREFEEMHNSYVEEARQRPRYTGEGIRGGMVEGDDADIPPPPPPQIPNTRIRVPNGVRLVLYILGNLTPRYFKFSNLFNTLKKLGRNQKYKIYITSILKTLQTPTYYNRLLMDDTDDAGDFNRAVVLELLTGSTEDEDGFLATDEEDTTGEGIKGNIKKVMMGRGGGASRPTVEIINTPFIEIEPDLRAFLLERVSRMTNKASALFLMSLYLERRPFYRVLNYLLYLLINADYDTRDPPIQELQRKIDDMMLILIEDARIKNADVIREITNILTNIDNQPPLAVSEVVPTQIARSASSIEIRGEEPTAEQIGRGILERGFKNSLTKIKSRVKI
jgi:hypothetical protein